MNNNHSKSRSSLFLMEMIITIFFFSISSAICVQCFVKANLIDKETIQLNHAVEISQNLAEVMRGTEGDIDSIMAVFPYSIKGDDNYFTLFYDDGFNECEPDSAIYAADISLDEVNRLNVMYITVTSLEDYKVIYSLEVTKYVDLSHG